MSEESPTAAAAPAGARTPPAPAAQAPSAAASAAAPSLATVRVIASLLFFLSGFTGLAYEVIWFKRFAHVWGNSTLAVAAVVGSFLAGLGLGAALLGRLSSRARVPLAWYGVAEICIGLLALLIPLELGWLIREGASINTALAAHPFVYFLARLVLTFLVIGPACMLMGGTLPLMVRQLTQTASELRDSTGWLYFVNTIGAACGCYFAGFHLLPTLGLSTTNWLTAATNVAIGVVALLAVRRLTSAGRTYAPAREEADALPDLGTSLAARAVAVRNPVVLLTGALAILLQIVWTRQLALMLGGSTYAFSAMLFVMLLGIALGSLLFRISLGSTRQLEAVSTAAIAVLVLTTVFGQMLVPELSMTVGLSSPLRASQLWNALLCVAVSGVLQFVPALVMGYLFPFYVHLTRSSAAQSGRAVGSIYAWNTVGAILGASLTSGLVVPAIGSTSTVIIALLLYCLALATVCPLHTDFGKLCALALPVGLGVVVFLAPMRHDPRVTDHGWFVNGYTDPAEILADNRLLFYEEGPSCNVLVTDFYGHVLLRVNGKVDASSTGDMNQQVGIAYFPRFLRPDAQKVMVIGYGSGASAGASLLFPGTHVTCCEIEPGVYAASKYFDAVNHQPDRSDRFEMHFDDGRNFLQGSLETWDLVISQPSNPWIAGIGNLFTREFYECAMERVGEHGLLAQWIQSYELTPEEYAVIVRTALEVCPYAGLIQIDEGDTLLVAGNSPLGPTAAGVTRAQALVDADPRIRQDLERYLGSADVRGLLLKHFMLDRAGLERLAASTGEDTTNTDLNLRLEFDAPKRLFMERPEVPASAVAIVRAATPEWPQHLIRELGIGAAQVGALEDLTKNYIGMANSEAAQALLAFSERVVPDHPPLLSERIFFAGLRNPQVLVQPETVATIGELPLIDSNSLGLRFFLNEHFPEGLAVFEAIVQARPRARTPWMNLARGYEAVGQIERARAAHDRAYELDPLDDDVLLARREFYVNYPPGQ